MTPEEKAKELVNRFYAYSGGLSNYNAKKCALICVDETIKVLNWNDHKRKKEREETFNLPDEYFVSYWLDVKQEIQKL